MRALQETLDEEGEADKKLTELAESIINVEAEEQDDDDDEEEDDEHLGNQLAADLPPRGKCGTIDRRHSSSGGRERTVKALAMYDIRHRHMTAEKSLDSMPLFNIDHPWPIVVFAYNYQTKIRGPHQPSDVACPCVESPNTPTTAASAPTRLK